MLRAAPERSARRAGVRRVLLLVLVLNLTVLALKLGAWWISGALSVLAEATHSSLDALNNVLALGFARVAARGPDEEHPYGHQKFETLGALVLVGFLSITVFELIKGAVVRLMEPERIAVNPSGLVLAILAGSIVMGVLVSTYEERKARELTSDLLLADAAHTRSDVLATLAVLVGLVGVRMGFPLADPLVTLVVAGLIGLTGWRIVQEIVPVLVDERAVEARRIREIAEATEGVVGCRDVRSRGRPGEAFAELVITVAPHLDVARSHEIADAVEARVAAAVGAREVVVHVEPSR